MAGKIFSKGDVVQLKSGGPQMTVSNLLEDYDSGLVECCWFVDDKIRYNQFDEASLKAVEQQFGPYPRVTISGVP